MALAQLTNLSNLYEDFETSFINDIDGILTSTQWAISNISYAFPDSTYAMTDGQKDQMRKAFEMVSSFANLEFTEFTGGEETEAIIRVTLSTATSTGFAYYPSAASLGGDILFSPDTFKEWTPAAGSWYFLVYMHELGHALGLAHGSSSDFFGALPSELDSMSYSVMSYRSYEGGGTGGYTNGQFQFAQSYMTLDIAALQALYGANWDNNSSKTIYSWDAVTGQMFINGVGQDTPLANTLFSSIWDAGGRDMLLLTNFHDDQVVNLRGGEGAKLSDDLLADLGNGKHPDYNVSFAFEPDDTQRALLESVKTGSGDDTIFGNAAKNLIAGRDGFDQIYGDEGDDKLKGNRGQDQLYGESGNDILLGGGGRDTLDGGPGDDILNGGSGRDKMTGGEGEDTFIFNSNSNVDRIRDFEIGVDLIQAESPNNVELIDFNGMAALVLGDAMMILEGHAIDSVVLSDILVDTVLV